uniref:PDZ domain-containing protein n=1 Tax=Pseudo-nitzschia australis TaxID=44445 RepID=A0A7S4EPU1_9STRA|mmetsp:Transcript_19757/g.42915  ORF Transcript_19757/g.42915 Transcript_19757/m.42915 type:complete len:156 (+) Transcript_19757:125-592(+)
MKNIFYVSIVFLVFGILLPCCCDAWVPLSRSSYAPRLAWRLPTNRRYKICNNMIGTGFSFEDGEQILVSVQKPFGIVLEQGGDTNSIDENATNDDQIVVTEVDPNGSVGRAGVRTGDVLVAVQNASTISADLTEVLDFIANKCPRVVNLRFQRPN